MRLAQAQHRAWSYKVTDGPTVDAVSLDTVKLHLKKSGAAEDETLTIYLHAAIDFAEKFTRRDFITRTYETFRDCFSAPSEGYYQFGGISGGNVGFEIRKSPLQAIEEIKYISGGTPVVVDSAIYYNTVEEDYSEVLTVDGACWPNDVDRRLQAITIIFKSGLGDAEEDMPLWVAEGVLLHVTAMWANRGDCAGCGDSAAKLLPQGARSIYLQNRIENL